jgi:hypothetical protein
VNMTGIFPEIGGRSMKPATGRYEGVAALTLPQMLEVVEKLRAARVRADSAWTKANAAWVRADSAWTKANAAKAEEFWTWVDESWKKTVKSAGGIIYDWWAVTFIAADREDGVYCYIWDRDEVWFYDGEKCPSRKSIEDAGNIVWRK